MAAGLNPRIVADLHTHTVASGHAYSTVEELARAAAAKGLKAIGVTDHGPALPGGAHPYHFWNLRSLPVELFGVRILKGAEANIIGPNGELDLDDELLSSLELVLVALHPNCGYEGTTQEAHTQAAVRALANPHVHIFAHPGNPLYPLDMSRLIEAARKNDVYLEINNSSFLTSRKGSRPHCEAIAGELARAGLGVTVNSDAHLSLYVGELDEALACVTQAGMSEERILNCSMDRLEEFLERKRADAPAMSERGRS